MINPLGNTQRALEALPAPPTPGNATPQPTGDVEFSYNPQDTMVMPPQTTVIHGVEKGPSVEKAQLLGGKKPKAQDGKFVYEQKDPQFHQAVSLATVAKTIEIFEGAMGETFQWAFDRPKIGIVADGGKDFNAYYSRDDASMNFFHDTDPVTKKTVFSADSGEVVAHETTHAILDGVHPEYFQTWSPDPAGFHEAFADVMAMLVSLVDDNTRAKVVEQTGGDLSKPNVAANLGEELGTAINHAVGENVTGGDYTRCAINKFTWQDPSTLPENGGPDELGSESHSYSRLWTGAFYDTLKGMTERNMAEGQDANTALKSAAEENLKLYGGLMKTAPRGDFAYRDMAVSLVEADKQYNGGKATDLIVSVYKERKILPEDFDPSTVSRNIYTSTPADSRTIKVKIDGPEFGKFSGATLESASASPLAQDMQEKTRVQDNVQRLISQGRILYTEPHQAVKTKDLFDATGRPYVGVVRWENGQMTIERVKIAM